MTHYHTHSIANSSQCPNKIDSIPLRRISSSSPFVLLPAASQWPSQVQPHKRFLRYTTSVTTPVYERNATAGSMFIYLQWILS